MEVSSGEEDFRPVLKPKRKKISVGGVEKDKVEQNLLNNNRFSPLTDNNNNNASPAGGGGTPVIPSSTKSASKQKQPPLVVKNLDFFKLLEVMKSCDVKPEYKMNRFDIKVICYSVDDFDISREHLKKCKVQFYTHERKNERPHRVVLRGLPDVEVEDVKHRLEKDYQLDVLDVYAIKRKKEVIVGETPYIVLFPKGYINLKKLSAVKKVQTNIVRWEAYRNKHPNVTQCKNCLHLGHGASNCFLKGRCNKCGDSHETEKCEAGETQAKRCANCSGDHEAMDHSCPKRIEFIPARQQASKQKPSMRKANKRTPKCPK